MTAPTKGEIEISASLQGIAAGLDTTLQQIAGERFGFALIVFPFDRRGNASYVSNARRQESLIGELRRLADRLEQGLPTPAIHRMRETNG